MSQQVSGLLLNAAKNKMLNDWRAVGYSIAATTSTETSRSNNVAVTFNAAANGKIELSTSVSLTINSGSEGANAISKILLFPTGAGLGAKNIEFTLAEAISFPDGGSLVVNSLSVELDDPA